MNKPRLAILSDIFGNTDEPWMKEYVRTLSPFFEISQFDCRKLAGINSLPENEIHSAFVNGGIDRAVQSLRMELNHPQILIGFSVGGTVAWKYALENAEVSLFLISATRLRNETAKPSSPLSLYYGELEGNGPSSVWFEKFHLKPILIENEGHECYKSQHVIEHVCQQIITDFKLLK